MPRIYGEIGKPRAKPKGAAAKGAKKRKLLLYVHVPFCRSRCRYCSFHSQTFNQVTFAWYLRTLLQEIELWGRRLGRPTIQTLYFGGGTPSLVPLPQLARIFDALHEAFDFEPGIEVSLEVNPDSGQDLGYFRGLAALGVNRLSIGLQSLADEDLARLGRPHSAAQAVEAFGLARKAGFANLGIDLIFGLPRQRLKNWLDQLKVVTRLKAEHLSCYSLTLEPNTPMGREAQGTDLKIAAEQELGKMYVYGAEYLESQGYLQYEISNFARMGFLCRHNVGYWEGRDYLGLGPSAVSTLGDRRFANSPYMDAYDAAVRGDFAGQDFEVLDTKTRAREMAMLALRTTKGLGLRKFAKLAGYDLVKSRQKLVDALHKNGLIRISQGHLRLTKNGLLVSNTIVEKLAF